MDKEEKEVEAEVKVAVVAGGVDGGRSPNPEVSDGVSAPPPQFVVRLGGVSWLRTSSFVTRKKQRRMLHDGET